MRRAVRVIYGVGALVVAAAGVYALGMAMRNVSMSMGEGSGGIAAVSSGLAEAFVDLLIPVLLNRVSAHPARRRGGLTRRLHTIHTVVLCVCVVLPLLFVFMPFWPGEVSLPIAILAIPVREVLWVSQYFVLSTVLGLLAVSPVDAAAKSVDS
jgi:hypothetical protein